MEEIKSPRVVNDINCNEQNAQSYGYPISMNNKEIQYSIQQRVNTILLFTTYCELRIPDYEQFFLFYPIMIDQKIQNDPNNSERT